MPSCLVVRGGRGLGDRFCSSLGRLVGKPYMDVEEDLGRAQRGKGSAWLKRTWGEGSSARKRTGRRATYPTTLPLRLTAAPFFPILLCTGYHGTFRYCFLG